MNTNENPQVKLLAEKFHYAFKMIVAWPAVLRYHYRTGNWYPVLESRWEDFPMSELNNPACYKLATIKKLVPFTESDIRTGMWFKCSPEGPNKGCVHVKRKAIVKDSKGIYFASKDGGNIKLIHVTWEDLQKYWVYSFDGEEKECKCEKEIDVAPE